MRIVVISAGLLIVSCASTDSIGRPCVGSTECDPGQVCAQAQCVSAVADRFDGGGPGGVILTGCNPAASDNAARDSDCDGLSDAEEYGTPYTGGAKTDPCRADSDGDGLIDGLELGRTKSVSSACQFIADAEPRSKSIPTQADSDGDGLSDGDEDANHNGQRDPGETNPTRVDTDCDGFADKEERESVSGCATDPTLKDSDGDGLNDGVESGLIGPGVDPANCVYTAAIFDFDPSGRTNACAADTDGDRVQDGAEDANLNGRVDANELDPKNGGDASGPAAQACSMANLRPVLFAGHGGPDVQVALATQFTEVNPLTVNGMHRGVIFYDPTTQVAGLVFSKTPAGADGVDEEAADRPMLGAVSNPLVQTLTTWDGFVTSARGTYDLSSTADVKAAINTIAVNFLGPSAMGLLSNTAGTRGPFKIQAQFVRRTESRAAIVIALAPSASYSGQSLFRLDDTTNGTALAQFRDFAGTQCEVFDASVNQKVDFLWVVDDSGSMASSQSAVSAAGNLFGAKLGNAGLDWRVAGASTGYYNECSFFTCEWDGSFRDWSNDIATMKGWFTLGSSTWFGIRGNGAEEGFAGASSFVNRLAPSGGPLPGPFRTDAAIHFIFLTDTREQSSISVAQMRGLMGSKYQGQPFMSHGIVCPEGGSCGDKDERRVGKYHSLVRQTGGILGSILTFNPPSPTPPEVTQQTALVDAILGAAIGRTGHQLQRPPISSTIKVSIASTRGACNAADVPRDRTNGWDIDSATRRIVFYGQCIPSAGGVKVAVSYRYWNDASTDPNGDACGATCVSPEVCDPNTKQCVCSANCGGCGSGLVCNIESCSCDPIIN